MRVDVGELLKASTGETRTYRFEDWELEEEAGGDPARVSGVATLLRTRAGILASVHLSLRARQPCSRCLKEVDIPLELDFEEEFLPTVDLLTGASLPSPGDSGVFLIDARQVLDLSEAARQYRETALPMQPLCRPDCAGLCPTCGRDLNLKACACPREPVDSRWSAFAELGRHMQDP